MNYPRIPYLDPSVEFEKGPILFCEYEAALPKIKYPISALENFKLAAEHKTPVWMPNSQLDFQTFFSQELAVGRPQGPDYSQVDEDYVFTDMFNVSWTWVSSAGGPMETPGAKPVIEDITEWEKMPWPNLDEWEWESKAKDFLKNHYDPSKVLHIDIGLGPTERLVACMGGYTESMLAMAMEPEACKDFLMRFADFQNELFDRIINLYPANLITLHDDWGTERDTFFSEQYMEDLVYEPMKKIIDHVKSKGCIFQLHSCGNATRFLPYMLDLGVDFWQLQRRAVDLPLLKEKYGDKIGFNSYVIDGIIPGAVGQGKMTRDTYMEKIRLEIERCGKSGGFYTSVSPEPDKELAWDGTYELYCYSREFYDKERGYAYGEK